MSFKLVFFCEADYYILKRNRQPIKMVSWFTIKRKFSNLLYRGIFYRFGYGRPDRRHNWEEGYAGGYWDHLESEDESERYKVISRLVQRGSDSPSVFDVGCGKGILYEYLKKTVSEFEYLGIDISENAVAEARTRSPEASFRQMDFDREIVDQKFDIIIFNETIEYFVRPLSKLLHCAAKNLLPGGRFIISMYKGHDGLWNTITPQFKVLEEIDIQNKKRQRWKIKLMQPK